MADIHHIGAARGEGAARRRPGHVGGRAGDGRQARPLLVHPRDRRQKPLRIGLGRRGEQRIDRRAFQRAPAIHDHDPLARPGDDAKIVGDEDHRHPEVALQVVQQLHDLRLHRHVERGGGLVRDQKVRPAQQRHGDHHPLAHAARELVRVQLHAAAGIGNPDRVQHPHGFRDRRRFAHALVKHQHLGHLVRHPHVGVEAGHRVLEHHRDPLGPQLRQRAGGGVQDFLPLEPDRPGSGAVAGQKPHDRKGELAFPRAGFAHDAQRLAPLDVKVDAVHGLHLSVRGGETDVQVFHFKQHLSDPSGPARRAARHRRRRTQTG